MEFHTTTQTVLSWSFRLPWSLLCGLGLLHTSVNIMHVASAPCPSALWVSCIAMVYQVTFRFAFMHIWSQSSDYIIFEECKHYDLSLWLNRPNYCLLLLIVAIMSSLANGKNLYRGCVFVPSCSYSLSKDSDVISQVIKNSKNNPRLIPPLRQGLRRCWGGQFKHHDQHFLMLIITLTRLAWKAHYLLETGALWQPDVLPEPLESHSWYMANMRKGML